jgi:hypothetical protein
VPLRDRVSEERSRVLRDTANGDQIVQCVPAGKAPDNVKNLRIARRRPAVFDRLTQAFPASASTPTCDRRRS